MSCVWHRNICQKRIRVCQIEEIGGDCIIRESDIKRIAVNIRSGWSRAKRGTVQANRWGASAGRLVVVRPFERSSSRWADIVEVSCTLGGVGHVCVEIVVSKGDILAPEFFDPEKKKL